jgi:hypothetical protein
MTMAPDRHIPRHHHDRGTRSVGCASARTNAIRPYANINTNIQHPDRPHHPHTKKSIIAIIMDSLDDLLASLAGGSQAGAPMPPPKSVAPTSQPPAVRSSIDALLQQIGNGPIASPSPAPPSLAPTRPAPADQALLGSIQVQYDRLDQDQRDAHQLVTTSAAQLWLDQLDPNSGEALWFEQFAEGYGSRLAAAIELLAAEQA